MAKDKFVYDFIDLYNRSLSELHRSGVTFGEKGASHVGAIDLNDEDTLSSDILNASVQTYAIIFVLTTLLALLTAASVFQFLRDTSILQESSRVSLSFQLPDTEAITLSPLEHTPIGEFTLAGAVTAKGVSRFNKYYFPQPFTDQRELPPVADLDMPNPMAVPVYHAPVYTALEFDQSSRYDKTPDLLLAMPDAKLPPPIILPPVPIYSINFLGLGDTQTEVILGRAREFGYKYNVTYNEFDNYNLFRVYREDPRGRYNINSARATLVGEFNLVEDAIIYANSISGRSFINEEQIIIGLTDIVICCTTLANAQTFAKSIDAILLNRPIYLSQVGYR